MSSADLLPHSDVVVADAESDDAAVVQGHLDPRRAESSSSEALPQVQEPVGSAGVRHRVMPTWIVGALWLVGIAVAAAALRGAVPELRTAAGAVAGADRSALVAAVALEAAALAVLPMTFRGVLRSLNGRGGYRLLLDAALGAFAVSRVVPAGGLAGAAYAMRRIATAGNNATVAVAVVTAAGVATMATLGVVVAGGVVLAAATRGTAHGLLWAGVGAVGVAAAAGAAGVVVLMRPDLVLRTALRIGSVLRRPALADTVARQLAVLTPLFDRTDVLARVVGWSAVNWMLQLAALWTVFLAFGVSMPIGVLIIGFGAANLATALPHTPGGIGVVEAGMTGAFVALGVPSATALVGVLCYRLVGHWLPVLVAMPLALRSWRMSTSLVQSGRPGLTRPTS